MGNSQGEAGNNAHTQGQKIVLKLRYRDIVLHYSFKMKLIISDIGIFPDHLEGLRLWDSDIVLSRFIILENQQFKNKDVMVFKAGVGIAGIALSKWGGCKSINMCDTRNQVVTNMIRNCERNQVKGVSSFLVNLQEFGKFDKTYDCVVCTDLFAQGFAPQVILNIWRKLLRVGGTSTMIVPDKKDQLKKLLELIDKEQFRINNLVLTAEEYEASPLFNKLQSENQFPLIGKSTFYAVCLTKLKEKNINPEPQKEEQKSTEKESSESKKQQIKTQYQTPKKIEQKPAFVPAESKLEQKKQQIQQKIQKSPENQLKKSQQKEVEQVDNTSKKQQSPPIQQVPKEEKVVKPPSDQNNANEEQPQKNQPIQQVKEELKVQQAQNKPSQQSRSEKKQSEQPQQKERDPVEQ